MIKFYINQDNKIYIENEEAKKVQKDIDRIFKKLAKIENTFFREGFSSSRCLY